MSKTSKPTNEKSPKSKPSRRDRSVELLRLRLKFWILLADLVLAGISIVTRVETPVVWTFLYGIGGWAALSNNPISRLR